MGVHDGAADTVAEQRPQPAGAAEDPAPGGRMRRPWWLRGVRFFGWTCISAGVVVLLYLVYALLFTNLETEAAQAELLDRWELEVGQVEAPAIDTGQAQPPDTDDDSGVGPPAVSPGAAVAVLQFHRPGSDVTPVREEPLFVVEGVSLEVLKRGPGHYPSTPGPGQEGNFAVAGHRTTYGAPFFDLDQLRPGDEIHVTDREGERHIYRVREQRIVAPHDRWVVGPDPLGTGTSTLTLTTCHPRFSNAERMIVFAELVI